MINIITQITNSLRKLNAWYEQRNSEQAVRVLYSKKIYLASAFHCINTFLNHFTKYSSVITVVLAISSFLGLHMNPVSWVLVGLAMIIGGWYSAHHSRNDYLNKANALKQDLELTTEQDGKILDLKTKIETEYEQQDALEYELEMLSKTAMDLGIPMNAGMNRSPSSNLVGSSVQKSSSSSSSSSPSDVEHGAFYLTLKQLMTYLVMPFIFLLNSLRTNVPVVADAITKLLEIVSPILTKLKEFMGILSQVTASLGGMVIGIAAVVNVNVANQSFIASLTMVAGSLSPISTAAIYSVIFVLSATLLINKVFFSDPYEQLAIKNRQERGGQADNLNQNQLLLTLTEYKNEILREKINILKLKINLKQPDALTSLELVNQKHAKDENAVGETDSILQKFGIFKAEQKITMHEFHSSPALSS